MNLPNYFLADLPPEAALTPVLIRECCQTLKRNREQYLAAQSTSHLAGVLSEAAANWLNPDDPLRRLALESSPSQTGFSEPILRRGLDGFFRHFAPANLEQLIRQDLGHSQRLDQWSGGETEIEDRRSALGFGPEFLLHVTAGNLPVPALMSLTLGVLVRSAQFVKCARGGCFLPRLFAHSIYQVDPKLASCLEIAEWEGGRRTDLDEVLFEEADCVTATGRDSTLESIRSRLPRRTRFLGYGQKVSFGFIAKEALTRFHLQKLATGAAEDVTAWDQMGCLSPHLFYVEDGAAISALQFAEHLAEELARRETVEPRRPLEADQAAFIQIRRDFYEIRAADGDQTQIWSSPDSTAWTVVYEADPLFQISSLNRFIHVKATAGLDEALHHAESVRGRVSTVGLAASGPRIRDLARQLARWGAARICPIGQMQNPPLTWRHDGRPALGDLVRWVDWERD
jgi:Acyl-CoA reductase (LuxC)